MHYLIVLSLLLIQSVSAQPQSRTIVHSGWHIVYDENISSENIRLVESYLDQSKNFYRNEWGLTLPEMISVRVYRTTASFQKAAHQPWFTAASWDGSAVHIQNPSVLKKRKMLQSTIIHEIAHIAVQSLWKQKPPLWFDEGFAVYCSNEIASLPRPVKKIDELNTLDNERVKATGFHALQQWYAIAGTLVFIFIREFGKDNLKNIFKQPSEKSFEERVASVLKTPYNLFGNKLINSFNFYIGTKNSSD